MTLTILISPLVISYVHSGAINGGGGRAVVCRNPDGLIKTAQLLDLYEATKILKLTPRPPEPSLEDEVYLVDKIMYSIDYLGTGRFPTQSSIDQFISKKASQKSYLNQLSTIQFIGPNAKLTETNDSSEPLVPTGPDVKSNN